MKNFNRLNNLVGWGAFAVALATYTLTVERTASFWDCGEFIACSFKLQVPHPPGSPLFLLIGRLFSMLALGDVTQVAYWVNMVSVLGSAFSILFLFWTITMLARKFLDKSDDQLTAAETVLILGSALVGALAYTWSDSFWFSAVEAEVYGLSSFFTAIVIWAAFKWERIEDPAAANRWLIFTAYLTGLSIGVHLLNLVTIPALALIYFFKKYDPTFWKGVVAVLMGLVILVIINSGIIPGLPSMAGSFELFFVNTLGLPYTSGVIFFIVAFLSGLVFAIRYTANKNLVIWNTSLLALAFILIGYSSYILALVRANYNPPINENNPKDVLSFVSYLKREQYGSRPLLYGPTYVSRPTSSEQGAPIYRKENGKYIVADYRPEYVYDAAEKMLLPRIYSTTEPHPSLYRKWVPSLMEGQKPTMGQNLSFMFKYQIGHMYWRYFLWNFVGRESDDEGAGNLLPTDTNEGVPTLLAKNKGRDNFYMLPFILGLLGVVIQFFRRPKDLLVLGMLFVLTGIALVTYLNSPPVEPRERDYIYVGSFYIFAMWIGLGVLAIFDFASKILKPEMPRAILATVIGLVIPTVMVAKGWDNHNRANRYHSVDFAKNLLNSCAPNAILFTGGDNDTFPLWYVQEVEGFRTDVRVCNLSLLGTHWYVDQMKRKTYLSEKLPISLEYENFAEGRNDIIPFYENPNVKNGINLKDYMKLVKTNSPAIQVPLTSGEMTSTLPSSSLFLPINTEAIRRMNIVRPDLMPFVRDTMQWNLGKRDLYKSDLIMLDIIATNDWKRPIYFSGTLSGENYLNLKEYMQLEGYAYRLMPVKVTGATDGFVNSDLMAENLMKKSFWREMNNPNTYYDNTFKGSPVFSARIAFFRLIDQLIREGKKEKAKEALNFILKAMPDDPISYDQISSNYVKFLFDVGETQRALTMAETIATRADQTLGYIARMGSAGSQDGNIQLYNLQTVVTSCREAKQEAAAQKYEAIFTKYAAGMQQ